MQKNEAGFKMEFKKRNPDFRKPPKKATATIPATGDLRKHDQPTRALKKSGHDEDSSSSSEEDVLEAKRKLELENQKSEQKKVIEIALLEQVMSGSLDVLELLKSGEIQNSALKEQLQKQMLDGIPTQQQLPPPLPVPAPPEPPKNPINPLMRNRESKEEAAKVSAKQKKPSSKKAKSSGSISSESSESSDGLSGSDVSSETDSDEDHHKLSKRVKKLKTKNKKLRKKVKMLKKRLKEKKVTTKAEPASTAPVKRNAHGQMVESAPVQSKGANAPMTPQQYQAQQAQMRRVYDPQTGQYRLVRGTGEIMEEIVSKSRHAQLNKIATQADGRHFQQQAHNILQKKKRY